MPELNSAPTGELPSARTLLRSTAVAVVVAGVLLVTAVLPAEYGVDPTGIGRVLGLTEMGEIKMALAREAAAAEAAEAAATVPVTPPPPAAPAIPAPDGAAPAAGPSVTGDSVQVHVTHVTLRPNESGEIKLVMRKGARARYRWTTDRGAVSFETHGDTLDAPPGVFHSYSKGRNARSHEGEFVAVFDGQHGWFWRNRSPGVVTITLRTEGEYRELKRLD